MARLQVLVLLLLWAVGHCRALDISGLPSCAAQCFTVNMNATACSILDDPCLCGDTNFDNVVTECIVASCTMRESLVAKKTTSNACGIPPSNASHTVAIVRGVFFSSEAVVFAARMLVKALRYTTWGHDDTSIVLGFLCTVTTFVTTFLQDDSGFGQDIWNLDPEQIRTILKRFVVLVPVHFFGLAVVKASFLFFYLRIFPDRKFRVHVLVALAFTAALGIASFISGCLQCIPLNVMWDEWDQPKFSGKCINVVAFTWTFSCLHILLDVWILFLPLRQVKFLQLPTRKKLGVMLMFGIGIFLTIVSIIRLHTIHLYASSYNVTKNYLPIGMWSALELHVGVLCACLPSVRILIVRLRNKPGSVLTGSRTGNGSSAVHSYRPPLRYPSKDLSSADSTPSIGVRQTDGSMDELVESRELPLQTFESSRTSDSKDGVRRASC